MCVTSRLFHIIFFFLFDVYKNNNIKYNPLFDLLFEGSHTSANIVSNDFCDPALKSQPIQNEQHNTAL